MKTLEQIKELYKANKTKDFFLYPLRVFIPKARLLDYDIQIPHEEFITHKHIEFTEENVLKKLESAVERGFQSAFNRKGMTSSANFDEVKLWNWILENELADFSEHNYAQYGLPLYKATALLYGFNNPIGNDVGNEYKYSSEYLYGD